jgi:hypothetical protein
MTLDEMLPSLQALRREDKLRLIELLAADVARQEGLTPPEGEGAHAIWSPYSAFDGAATLLRALDEEKAAS